MYYNVSQSNFFESIMWTEPIYDSLRAENSNFSNLKIYLLGQSAEVVRGIKDEKEIF